MKGILRKIEKKELKTKDGKKFTKFEFTCDVIFEDTNDVKTYKGDYSEKFALDYFGHCYEITGVKILDRVGTEVEVVLGKRPWVKEGNTFTVTYIKFLNFYDNDGNIIRMLKKGDVVESDLPF